MRYPLFPAAPPYLSGRTAGLALGLLCLAVSPARTAESVLEFNRDIRPILSDKCFACHGPDKNQRKGDLRLDKEQDALANRDGHRVIVPGKPEDSELVKRIDHAEAGQRMPPAKFGKKLTPAQAELLKRWIAQGGKYQKHWSLIPPTHHEAPRVSDANWPRNSLDRFLLARLDQEELRPSPEADRRTLLRGLYFDLIGLPPSPAEVDAFVNDRSPGSYEKVVDQLLASRHFGERLALYWLDLVRYADTNGYHGDNHHDIAPYRDYVIDAFNANKRFNRFTIEQLAGDLLPDATLETRIASGYNRLLMVTREGGAQAKEYQAKYSADRVRNVSSVWLGATLGCAECHDHKFDPFTTREFYQLAAFFADIKETAVGEQETFTISTPEQSARLRQLEAELAGLNKQLDTTSPELEAAERKWEESLKGNPAPKGPPKPIADIVAVPADKRTDAQKKALSTIRTLAPQLEPIRQAQQKTKGELDQLRGNGRKTLISMAIPPRTMRVLPRGNWLDDSGEIIEPGTPAALGPLAVQGRRATRLDLAQWLVSDTHPLVARVFVNRLWKMYFGRGLVTSLEDFGAQGSWPTYPDLLDDLAIEFRTSGWDIKHMVRLMVLSAAYRQSSLAGETLRHKDPYNNLVARQGRFRLDAEMVRDNALAVSGLLSLKIGGPSVKPYQPAGFWSYLNFPKREWQADKGESLYRRSLYTYWCRTFLHPSLAAFDAPSREECTVERARSNTPQQALVLLNDPIYVEAARALAERLLKEGVGGVEERLQLAFRLVLQRKATPEEVKLLTALRQRHLEQYKANPASAQELLHTGEHPLAKDADGAELASWLSVARVLLNLHETITRN